MYAWRKLTPERRAQLVEERLRRGFPPHSPPHPARGEQVYLLSASCYGHVPHMQPATRRQAVLDALFAEFISTGIELRAWVVLPNHYHLLALIPDLREVGEALRRVHGPLAREWNLEDGTPGRKVWYRFSDRAMRSESHYYTTLNYIHYNPCKHACAESPYAWPQSRVHWYLEHEGREWLRDIWRSFPLREYGRGWDEEAGDP
jgi:putative transposase